MSSAPGLTRHLAEYVVAEPPSAVVDSVAESIEELILDALGAMLVGIGEPECGVLRQMIQTLGGKADATVVGWAGRVSLTQAALVNGASAHALDLDDTHQPGMLHPSAVLLPALLALGEVRQRTGRELVISYLYGLDLMAALGRAINPDHYALGWHPTSTIGTLATAAASARLAGLGSQGIETALSISTSMTGGIQRNFGSAMKPIHAGLAASAAVTAVLLSELGCSAGAAALEGPNGWLDLHRGRGQWLAEEVTESLDHSFGAALDGLALKRFASCGVTHPPIEAALAMRKQLGAKTSLIERLELAVHPLSRGIARYDHPVTPLEGRCSFTHCVAIALLDGKVSFEQFDQDRVNASDVDRLRRRVVLVDAPELSDHRMAWGCRLTAALVNGTTHTVEVAMARGKWAGERLPHAEVLEKFHECAREAGLSEGVAKDCVEMVTGLTSAPTLGPLADLLQVIGNELDPRGEPPSRRMARR